MLADVTGTSAVAVIHYHHTSKPNKRIGKETIQSESKFTSRPILAVPMAFSPKIINKTSPERSCDGIGYRNFETYLLLPLPRHQTPWLRGGFH